jgi:plasmid stabilization system protein ParE
MKVVYTDEALGDLEDVFAFVSITYPDVLPALQGRIRASLARIAEWPESAPQIDQRSTVRVCFIGKYPYRIFYRIADDSIEVLHIYHGARQWPLAPE